MNSDAPESGIIYFSGSSRAPTSGYGKARAPGILDWPSSWSQSPQQHQFESSKSLLGYVARVWVHEHDVPDDEKSLQEVTKARLNSDYQAFLSRGGVVPNAESRWKKPASWTRSDAIYHSLA
jgi:hypothetical protein